MVEKIPAGASLIPAVEKDIQAIRTIQSYHAHIYFETPQQRLIAERIRAEIALRFSVLLGRWHDVPVGPHALPMYQVAFMPEEFARFAPWLMLNRCGLTVLLHPNTGQPRADHTDHAVWMGQKLEIRHLQRLPESEGPEPEYIPNTSPTVSP
ncbi:DOPA 4,5-dioxygenase family protein [Cedecea neteri]|uniref:DOPA 4,5-dioxygenase family protein n=1 Tax=Cedecea neteri TaxID=158822 RepID=UPI0005D9D536|nr:DOPA 4,5-dioxygenase family protein [Cedecea neteri]AJZ90301.1 dioxygenase [Klebsiella michiganensis]WPU24531.1 DOPA 4,5-dioxygenase family protein [Cedecea neteri]